MLTPSEVAWFHPARFAREKKLLDAVGLPHTERKYDASELGTAVLAAALLGAEEGGAVTLAVGKTWRLSGLRKVDAVLVGAGPKADAFPAGTLEAAARAAVADGPRDAEAVVEAMLREDAPDPYAWATWLVARGAEAPRPRGARAARRVAPPLGGIKRGVGDRTERDASDGPD